MDMSHDYMKKTASKLAEQGFTVTASSNDDAEIAGASSHSYRIAHHENFEIELQCVVHPEVGERYFLSIERCFGLASYSFRLDSWKLFPDRIEFKYHADEVSLMAPSLRLSIVEITRLSELIRSASLGHS